MNKKHAIKILKEEKSWESDDRIIDAFNAGIEAIEKIEQIAQIVNRKHICSSCEVGLARCNKNCLTYDKEEIKQILFSIE